MELPKNILARQGQEANFSTEEATKSKKFIYLRKHNKAMELLKGF